MTPSLQDRGQTAENAALTGSAFCMHAAWRRLCNGMVRNRPLRHLASEACDNKMECNRTCGGLRGSLLQS